MAWVAAALGASAATASPSAAKHAIPTSRVRITAGTVRHTIWTP